MFTAAQQLQQIPIQSYDSPMALVCVEFTFWDVFLWALSLFVEVVKTAIFPL